jgi:uncharacterized protein (DUF1501 family)
MNRRNFLVNGGIMGLSLGSILKAQASQKSVAKAKNVIFIYLPGGMAHQESWIPIPDAPIEYRGPLSAIKTKVPGLLFSENLKNTAKIADKITVIRSMNHNEAAHERGSHSMLTAYQPSPALVYPSFGSVVAHELGDQNNLPPYVAIPNKAHEYAGVGYLPSSFSPFGLGSNPENSDFKVRDLNLYDGVNISRFEKRKTLRQIVEAQFSAIEKADSMAAMDKFYQQAYSLISSEKAREAFDISKEDSKIRDRYGRNAAGQRFLLARRLIEGGVRFVTVTYGSWDHHDGIKSAINSQLPSFDMAFSALIEDLDQKGLLDETLVVVTSEFGRTPKINRTAGRDHWPKLFGTVMAGGGIKQGAYYGSPDATGSEVEEDPVSPQDFGATIYHLLGINPEKRLVTADNRPIEIVKDGNILKDILA